MFVHLFIHTFAANRLNFRTCWIHWVSFQIISTSYVNTLMLSNIFGRFFRIFFPSGKNNLGQVSHCSHQTAPRVSRGRNRLWSLVSSTNLRGDSMPPRDLRAQAAGAEVDRCWKKIIPVSPHQLVHYFDRSEKSNRIETKRIHVTRCYKPAGVFV